MQETMVKEQMLAQKMFLPPLSLKKYEDLGNLLQELGAEVKCIFLILSQSVIWNKNEFIAHNGTMNSLHGRN